MIWFFSFVSEFFLQLKHCFPVNFKTKINLLSKSFIQLEKNNKDKMEMNVLHSFRQMAGALGWYHSTPK